MLYTSRSATVRSTVATNVCSASATVYVPSTPCFARSFYLTMSASNGILADTSERKPSALPRHSRGA